MENTILEELREIKKALLLNKKVLTLEEFCQYAGISKNYAYQLTSGGKIRFYRPFGKMVYFDLDDVVDFLKRNPARENVEIEKNATALMR